MRGTVVKRLRALIRKTAEPSKLRIILNNQHNRYIGTLFYEGYRKEYQDAKRVYLKGKGNEKSADRT